MDGIYNDMIYGVVAAVFTLGMAYLRSKQKEAYDQGDLVIVNFGKAARAFSILAVAFPKFQPLASEVEATQALLEKAWNDPRTKTKEMAKLLETMADLITESERLVDSFKKA